MTTVSRRLPLLFLWIECLLLTLGIPLTLWLTGFYRVWLYTTLWVVALTCVLLLRLDPSFNRQLFWNSKAITLDILKRVSMLFVPLGLAIAVFTWLYEPERFFSFPRERPQMWAMVMLLYPILSVYPQELIYRAFFFHRYAALFGRGWLMIVTSALAFGFAHIMMGNWIAMVFSALGGLIFGWSYQRRGSLLLTSIEHALYGNFIFTVGLGWYFFHRAH